MAIPVIYRYRRETFFDSRETTAEEWEKYNQDGIVEWWEGRVVELLPDLAITWERDGEGFVARGPGVENDQFE